jgi:hypothetical protein
MLRRTQVTGPEDWATYGSGLGQEAR